MPTLFTRDRIATRTLNLVTMPTVDERNAIAKTFVSTQISKAAETEFTASFLQKYADADNVLRQLIPIKANGFRGVVLTAIVGMHLDEDYNPISNFYDCNPRSIFEKGIFYALTEARVPCGKSDPLNVAKNAQHIDETWARGRRPESAAMAASTFISMLWSNRGTPTYNHLVALFFKRLYEYAAFVESQNAKFVQLTGTFDGSDLAHKLARFTLECPEGGAVPQYIVGLLLRYLRTDEVATRTVVGFEESVFGTNTTSKKPADVWELYSDGTIGKLSEITVKTIDAKRLDDCVQSLVSQRLADKEVLFICNLPDNAAALPVVNGSLIHNGIYLQFVDIKQFVTVGFTLLDPLSQRTYFDALEKFIFLPTRAVATKKYWAVQFAGH